MLSCTEQHVANMASAHLGPIVSELDQACNAGMHAHSSSTVRKTRKYVAEAQSALADGHPRHPLDGLWFVNSARPICKAF